MNGNQDEGQRIINKITDQGSKLVLHLPLPRQALEEDQVRAEQKSTHGPKDLAWELRIVTEAESLVEMLQKKLEEGWPLYLVHGNLEGQTLVV